MGGEEGLGVTTGQPNLYKQDLSKLDVSKLTALSREVISRQATINIGTIGHVAHGKSTIVKAISGVQTVRFKNELERNITIKLDARAKDNSGTGQEENLGGTSDMSPVREKRSASPGFVQLSAKHCRIEEKSPSSQEDTQNDGILTSISTISNDILGQEEVRKETANEEENSYYSDDWRVSRRSSRLSSRLSISSNDTNIENRYNLRNTKLKELRVILEDIKHGTRGGMNTLLAESDLWEVEEILAKDEVDGQPVYLIKWKNWDSEYNTWEPVTNLVNCPAILNEFERSRLKLLSSFKQKTNFYPNDRDIEKFLSHRKMKGEALTSISVNLNTLYSNIRNFLNRKYVKGSKWEVVLKHNVLRMLVADSRMKQLRSLEKWEQEMNSITKERPSIKVENMVDLEGAPQNFYYIEDYLPGNGVVIPDDPPIGCECNGCNSKTKECCFDQNNLMCPYTATQKIRVPPGTPIYECNKKCRCGTDCMNRVVQRGTEVKLCIFRTSNGRGWGVKALQLIKKGTFVTEYVGEVITNEEAEKRGKKYDACGRTYLFDLDYNETEGQCPYTVDAAMYGNVSHFINHSCDPNLAVYAVWINCLDPNLPKLALFAMRDIGENEEITFDYTCQSSNGENSMKQEIPANKNLNEYIDKEFENRIKLRGESDSVNKKTLCKCGAQSCRQYVF